MVWFMGFLVYIFLSRASINLSRRDHILLIGFFITCALTRLAYTHNAYDMVYAGSLALMLFFSISYFQQYEIVAPKAIASLIVFNSDISYALYLIHYTLLDIIFNYSGANGIRGLLIGLVVSNLAAIAIFLAFDRHHKTIGSWLKQSFNVVR